MPKPPPKSTPRYGTCAFAGVNGTASAHSPTAPTTAAAARLNRRFRVFSDIKPSIRCLIAAFTNANDWPRPAVSRIYIMIQVRPYSFTGDLVRHRLKFDHPRLTWASGEVAPRWPVGFGHGRVIRSGWMML